MMKLMMTAAAVAALALNAAHAAPLPETKPDDVGFTQQGLARSARLSVSTVSRLEHGGRPGQATVAALARSLGIRVEELDQLAPSDRAAPSGRAE